MSAHRQAVLVVLLGLLVLAALAPCAPLLKPVPARDAGVFLYMGWRILSGELPYRDVWDHKPPAIHYINALGLFIGRGSAWGVWLLELLSLACAVVLGFVLIKQAFGALAATFASVVWLASLPLLISGGNLTEEFALPLQFAALYWFFQAEKGGRYGWQGYAIGLAFAGAFLLRQNLVGVWLSAVLYLLLGRCRTRRWRTLVRPLATMLLAASSIVLVVAYFASRDALAPFWDAVFRYNSVYARVTLAGLLRATWEGFGLLWRTGLSTAALGGAAIGLLHLLRSEEQTPGAKALLGVSLIGLPVELVLSAASGKTHEHYFMAWLPVLAVLAAYAIRALQARFTPSPARVPRARTASPLAVCVLFFAAAMSVVPAEFIRRAAAATRRERAEAEASRCIQEMTSTGDYVLMWGAETSLNFVSRRQSPTRFVYQYPLYTSGYRNPALVQEFLADITVKKPRLIIDTSASNAKIPAIDPSARDEKAMQAHSFSLPAEMDGVFDYIAAHYRLVRRTSAGMWSVYVYTGE